MLTPSVSLNWSKILSKCSPTVRKTILETRAHHEDLRRQISEFRQTLPQLDFAAYRQGLPQEKRGLVDLAEKEFKAFRPIKDDCKASMKALEEERELKMKLSQEFVISLNTKVDSLKGQLFKLENSKPVDEITVQDVYEMNPELKEKIHEAIRNDHWAIAEDSKDSVTTSDKGKQQSVHETEKLNYL